MKLLTITDMTHHLQAALHGSGFATIPVRKGVIDVVQTDASGRVSQRFRIRVNNPPEKSL